jgi:hypothetical protein
MTPFPQKKKTHGRWYFRGLACLIVCLPAVAQDTVVPPPMDADAVIRRVVQMNETRGTALEGYSSIRSYHLECHCLSHKKADMVVRVDYQAPDRKVFTIMSESGSGTVRKRVFKKLLEAEEESMSEMNQQRTALTPENYVFQLLYSVKTKTGEFYVLDVEPRTKNKFLFRGRIWVDAKDFAITRIEGQPAANPSWWTERTEFKRSYRKIGDFWLPESNESETKVRIFGTAILSIQYGDYQIKQASDAKLASNLQEPLNGQ